MSESTENVRYYTRARRIKTLIGKLPEGTVIPLGPYTVPQVVAFFLCVYGLSKTTWLWARGDVFQNITVAVVLMVMTVFLLGKLPSVGRNPLSWVAGVVSLMLRPVLGTYKGQPIRVGRPHVVRHRLSLPAPCPSSEMSDPVPAPEEPTPDNHTAAPAPALSGVQLLLAGARKDPYA